MVRLASQLIGVSLVLGLAQAAPVFQRGSHSGIYKKDSSSGVEVAVSAPNGVVQSDTSELSSQLASETAAAPTATLLPDDGSGVATIDSTDIPTDLPPSGTDGAASDGDTSTDAPLPTVVSAPPAAPPSAPPSYGSSYNTPSYGSGYSSWMVSYNDCVQTCMATYPPPPTTYSPPSLPPSESSGSSDSLPPSGSDSSDESSGDPTAAATGSSDGLSIVVAPHKGVLRYVPPFVTAQVGQQVTWTWGAGPHTVTESSQATPCNHSIGGFQSGQQNASFVFTQTINSTDPLFFYCGVPTHCQKGMFGAINPPTAPGANTSVAAMMPQWASMDADIMAAMTALNNTNNLAAVPKAATWADDVDVSGIDPSFHVALAKDILYTRMAMAANPHLVSADGQFNPTSTMNVPADLSAYLDSANAGSGAVNAANATTSDSSSATDSGSASGTSSTASQTPAPNSAASMKSSGIAIALAAVVAVVFAL